MSSAENRTEERAGSPFAIPAWTIVRFLCRHVVYLGVLIPIVLVAAFALGPRVIAWCGVLFDPLTLVQPIQVSEDFRREGYTDETLQHMLVDTLSDVRKEAESVTPSNDTEHVLSEFKLPDFTVPGTGLSVRPLIEFARTLLRRDSSVYGTVAGGPSSFVVMLTLHDPDGRTFSLSDEATPDTADPQPGVVDESHKLKRVVRHAAMAILQHQSPLLYASYLTQIEQKRCLNGDTPCDFDAVRERFEQLAAGSGRDASGASKEDAAWALLALSKLDSYARDYEGSIRHAKRIVEQSDELYSWVKVRPWAYYNWGVALADMGCYQPAADVLKRAVELQKNYAPAHNALARAWLALAQMPSPAASGDDYRDAAVRELRIAIDKEPGYQEAYVNLGDALRLPSMRTGVVSSGSLDEAREAYRTAVALDIDHGTRAYERLASMHDNAFVKVVARITQSRAQCASGMAGSLLESWGCSDAQITANAGKSASGMQAVSMQPEAQAKACSNIELQLPVREPSSITKPNGGKIIEVKNVDGASKPRVVMQQRG